MIELAAAAIAKEMFREILEWVKQRTQPSDMRRYLRCPVCGSSWWGDDERHNLICWVPRLQSLIGSADLHEEAP